MRENKGKLKQMKNSFARPANSCEVHTTSEVLFFQIKEKLCSCAELNVCQFVWGKFSAHSVPIPSYPLNATFPLYAVEFTWMEPSVLVDFPGRCNRAINIT